MDIISNGHRRELHTYLELPPDTRRDFDYLEPNDHYDPRFFHYRGAWYDLFDMMTTDLPGWDAIEHDTFYSAILVRWHEDDGFIVVATALA